MITLPCPPKKTEPVEPSARTMPSKALEGPGSPRLSALQTSSVVSGSRVKNEKTCSKNPEDRLEVLGAKACDGMVVPSIRITPPSDTVPLSANNSVVTQQPHMLHVAATAGKRPADRLPTRVAKGADLKGKSRQLPYFVSTEAALLSFSEFGGGKSLFDAILDTERDPAFEEKYCDAIYQRKDHTDSYEQSQHEALRRERAIFSLAKFGPTLVNDHGVDPQLIAKVLVARGPWNILASISQLALHATTRHFCDAQDVILNPRDNLWHNEKLAKKRNYSHLDAFFPSDEHGVFTVFYAFFAGDLPAFSSFSSTRQVFEIASALANWGPYLVARFGFEATSLVKIALSDEPELILSKIKEALVVNRLALGDDDVPIKWQKKKIFHGDNNRVLPASTFYRCQEMLADFGLPVDDSLTLHEAQSLVRWVPVLKDRGFDLTQLPFCHDDYRQRCMLYPTLASSAHLLLREGILTAPTLMKMTNQLGTRLPLGTLVRYLPSLRALGYSENVICDVVCNFSSPKGNFSRSLFLHLGLLASVTPTLRRAELSLKDIVNQICILQKLQMNHQIIKKSIEHSSGPQMLAYAAQIGESWTAHGIAIDDLMKILFLPGANKSIVLWAMRQFANIRTEHAMSPSKAEIISLVMAFQGDLQALNWIIHLWPAFAAIPHPTTVLSKLAQSIFAKDILSYVHVTYGDKASSRKLTERDLREVAETICETVSE